MNIRFEKTKLKTLTWCIEDWVPLFFIVSFVREFYHYKDLELIKKTSFEVIKTLLKEELVIAGDLLPGNTFITWNMPINNIITKIKLEWENLGRELIPHEIVWFDITEKGRKELEFLNSLLELRPDPFYFDDE